jgi:DNA-binding NarL/FixJ family response regulator
MDPIRVLIVDDQKLFAESLNIVLDAEPTRSISVGGIANGGAEAVSATGRLNPDVILMDVHMPELDGVEATRLIHEERPEIKIIMLTTFDDDVYVQNAVANGAMGYILKNVDVAELVSAIRAVHAGNFLVSPSVRSKLAGSGGGPARDRKERIARILGAFHDLTAREAEVLLLVIDSYDNHEIAGRLGIAEQTVKNYTSTIYAKLGVRDRIHAVRHVNRVLDASG